MPSRVISRNALVGDAQGDVVSVVEGHVLLTIVGTMSAAEGPHPDLRCPICSHLIKVVSDRIVEHLGSTGDACESGERLAEIPRVTVSAPFECDECGQLTKSNLRTGVVHSHNLPGDTRVCSNSGRFIGPLGGSVVVRLLPEPTVLSPVPRVHGYNDEAHSSVRAVRGGLPGLGRRR